MKKIYLMLLFTAGLFLFKTQAQVSSYSFSQSSGTYTPITGGTLVGQATNATPGGSPESATMDDHTYTGITIPFSFTFNGVAYTSLNANTNGWISFGATSTSTSTPISGTETFSGVVSGFANDMMGIFSTTATRTSGSAILTAVANTSKCVVGAAIQGSGIPAGTTIVSFDATSITISANATSNGTGAYISWTTGEIRTETLGSAPNRIFVVQFKGLSEYSTTAGATNNNSADFQIRLNEGGGNPPSQTVEVVYGEVFRAAGSETCQVGLRGGTNGDYNNRTSTTDWAATTAGASNAATITWGNTINPSSGLTFVWTPNFTAVDYCNIQFPGSVTIPYGSNTTVYTQGYEPGVTEPAGQGAGISVWIGVSSTNTDPATWAPAAWTAATYNTAGPANNNDEYMADIGSALAVGTYYYASRWQLNGGLYRYGGYSSGGGGFWDGTANINGVLTVNPPPPPVNDNCAGAISLTSSTSFTCTAQTAGTTLSATQSTETAPTCGAAGVNDDVWYSFVATGTTHIVTLSGVSGTTDMAMALYSGSCGSLVQLACSDPNVMTVPGLAAGQTYYVRVWTFTSTAATTATFNICVTVPLANDICSGAISLPVNSSCTPQTFNMSGATDNNETGDCTAGTEAAVWFSFVATSSAATVTVTGAAGFDAVLGVITTCGTSTSPTGGACVDATGDAGTEVRNLTGLTAGNTYYIQVYDYQGDVLATSTFDICVVAINCPAPTGVTTGSVTSTTASVTWTGTGTFIVEYGPTGFTPGTGATAGAGGTVINPATSPQAIGGLTPSTAYQVYVRQDCSGAGNGYSANSAVVSFTTLAPPPANDEAPGALEITVGSACTSGAYSNVNGTLSTNESRISCKGSQTSGNQVWFKFVAPASGFVKVSTDISGGTLTDTRIGLFSATDVNDYATFAIIACDDDNGSTVANSSTLYASGLTGGATYYVAVDQWNGAGTGTFCIEVNEVTGAMISAGTSCTGGQDLSAYNQSYTGWLSVTDNSGNLRAMVRNPAGGTGTFTYNNSLTINAAAVRQSPESNTYYLDRNFRIANSAATNIEVRFFFLASELAALNAIDGTTLGTLAATRQLETVSGCQANFSSANGSITLLPQSANGTSGDGLINWIQVTTPGFSNFYLNRVGTSLPVTIEYFRGTKQNSRNVLDWKVSCYNSPTVTLTLERSADGRLFKGINTTTETATRCLQPFNYNDLSPLAGINYYRLKSVDVDGKVSYSNVVALLNKDKGFEIVSLAPNPVKDEATLSVTSAERSIMEIVVSDLNGKQIIKQRVSLIAGNNQLPLNLRNVAAGTYQVSGLTADGQSRTLRFVKQ